MVGDCPQGVHSHLLIGPSSGSLPNLRRHEEALEGSFPFVFLVGFHFFANKVICFTTHVNVFDICHKTQVRQFCLLLKQDIRQRFPLSFELRQKKIIIDMSVHLANSLNGSHKLPALVSRTRCYSEDQEEMLWYY